MTANMSVLVFVSGLGRLSGLAAFRRCLGAPSLACSPIAWADRKGPRHGGFMVICRQPVKKRPAASRARGSLRSATRCSSSRGARRAPHPQPCGPGRLFFRRWRIEATEASVGIESIKTGAGVKTSETSIVKAPAKASIKNRRHQIHRRNLSGGHFPTLLCVLG
jgi:hypothetical protein